MSKKYFIENKLADLCKSLNSQISTLIYADMSNGNAIWEEILIVYTNGTSKIIDISRTSLLFVTKQVLNNL